MLNNIEWVVNKAGFESSKSTKSNWPTSGDIVVLNLLLELCFLFYEEWISFHFEASWNSTSFVVWLWKITYTHSQKKRKGERKGKAKAPLLRHTARSRVQYLSEARLEMVLCTSYSIYIKPLKHWKVILISKHLHLVHKMEVRLTEWKLLVNC